MSSLAPIAQPLDGPWADAVRAIAAEHEITVVAGMFTPGSGGRVRNTLLATGAGVEASYDKIHLFDAFGFRESKTVAPGIDPVTIDVDGVTVGLTTCYDVRFPGLYQALAEQGAMVIAAGRILGRRARQAGAVGPADQGQGAGQHQLPAGRRRRRIRPRSGAAPRGSAPTGIGGSVAVSPLGEVIAQLDEKPGLLVVDVDPQQADRRPRAELPVLANRRF